MRVVSRRNIFAVVVGVLLAGIPYLAFNYWVEGVIDRQGEIEVGTAARRATALAEARVRDAIGALDHLAGRGVNSCDPAQIEAMRQAAFSTIPVKEVSVVGPDAETLCTDLGLPLGDRRMVSSELLVGATGYWLDIIAWPGGERMVRLRRQVGAGPQRRCRAGADDIVPAASLDARRTVQRLCADHDEARNDHRRGWRKIARGGGCGFRGNAEVRQIRLRYGDSDATRAHRNPLCGSQMVWPARGRDPADRGDRHCCIVAARNDASPDGGNRACARGRRIRSILPAHRRYPHRPAAWGGSSRPLAQAGRHAGAAGCVHSANGIKRLDPHFDAKPDAKGS